VAKNLASQIIAWYGDQLDQHIHDAPDAVRWWLQLGFNLTDAKHTVLPDRGNHHFGQTATKICLRRRARLCQLRRGVWHS